MFTIDRFHPRDLVRVMQLATRTLPERYPPEFFLTMSGTQSRHFRVARDSVTGEVLGFLLAAREPGLVANVLMLAVDPGLQGQGIGRALLKDAQRNLALDDVRALRLEVRVDNVRAIRFYRRMGFDVVGLEPGVYRDGADALAMTKPLV